MAPRGTGSANGRVAYQKLETLAAQDDIMRRARRDRARAEHREGGPIEFLWPLLFSLCFILLVAVAIHGFTDHTSMGHGMGAGRRGGPDDPLPYDSLDPGDIGAVWTTARVLRHFRARTAAAHSSPRASNNAAARVGPVIGAPGCPAVESLPFGNLASVLIHPAVHHCSDSIRILANCCTCVGYQRRVSRLFHARTCGN